MHRLWRYTQVPKSNENGDNKNLITADVLEKLKNMDVETLKRASGFDHDMINQLKTLEIKDGKVVGLKEKRPEIGKSGQRDALLIPRHSLIICNVLGMMVSLDHSIYFHSPRDFRADEWMLAEAETPWAGDGRGLVMQRIFSKDGKLIASCVQEGVVRLKQDSKL